MKETSNNSKHDDFNLKRSLTFRTSQSNAWQNRKSKRAFFSCLRSSLNSRRVGKIRDSYATRDVVENSPNPPSV